MSTRCFIGIQTKNTIIGVYCHHDGYPSYMGNLLLNNYRNLDVWKLIAVGNMSACNKTPLDCEPLSSSEQERIPREHQNVGEIFKSQPDFEYAYLWNQNEEEWYYCSRDNQNLKVLKKNN